MGTRPGSRALGLGNRAMERERGGGGGNSARDLGYQDSVVVLIEGRNRVGYPIHITGSG